MECFGGGGKPWPYRVEAFLVACAIHAADRERELTDIVEGLAKAK